MAGTSLGAIAGLGITKMSREWMGPAPVLAAEAIRLAIADAGLRKTDIDGLLVNAGPSSRNGYGASALSVSTQNQLGLRDLALCSEMVAQGSTAAQMVQYAAMAIAAGLCKAVVCVYADASLAPGASAGSSYGMGRFASSAANPIDILDVQYGLTGANAMYALAARRHMALYGTSNDHFGAVAVSNRQWATMNPHAIYRTPLTIEEYHASRWIAEPFHLFDCTMVNNGAVAVVVTSAERARDMAQPPVHVLGMGQGHPGNPKKAPFENEVNTGAAQAGRTAFAMAGVTVADIDICELYDCYTYTTIVTLEDYGFCEKGEGGPFVADGRLAPGGALPTNTGGGQLSSYYMWGMTPLSEAVIQARGQGGERQVEKHDLILVSSQGGLLDHHGTLIVSPHAGIH